MTRAGITLLLFSLLSLRGLAAEDLGVVGKTYEIAETDLLEVIHRELRAMETDGRLARERQRLQARVKARVRRPPGIRLPRATESRAYHYDPSVTTEYDIIDDRGNVIYTAGTAVNPLDYTALRTPIVFFDGDDQAQADWVREFVGVSPDRHLLLMTNGPVVELMQEWNIRLYFDQHGRYSEKFGIRALPAVVRQDGARLRIDEIALETS